VPLIDVTRRHAVTVRGAQAPERRTFASALQASALCTSAALRHPGFACSHSPTLRAWAPPHGTADERWPPVCVTRQPGGGCQGGRSSPGRHRRRCRSRNSNSERFMTPLVPGCVGFRFRPGPTQSDHAFAGDRQRALRRVRALSVSANPDGKPLLIIPPKRALPQSRTILVNTHATPRTVTFTPACAHPHRNICTLFSCPRQDPSFSGMCSCIWVQ
jgi:hypothetical protein